MVGIDVSPFLSTWREKQTKAKLLGEAGRLLLLGYPLKKKFEIAIYCWKLILALYFFILYLKLQEYLVICVRNWMNTNKTKGNLVKCNLSISCKVQLGTVSSLSCWAKTWNIELFINFNLHRTWFFTLERDVQVIEWHLLHLLFIRFFCAFSNFGSCEENALPFWPKSTIFFFLASMMSNMYHMINEAKLIMV